MRADIVPGAVFPDYALSDHRGVHRKLSEHWRVRPLNVSLGPGLRCHIRRPFARQTGTHVVHLIRTHRRLC